MSIKPNTERTIWVCVNCMLHHANGECGDCFDDEHPEKPLNLLDPALSAMGMMREDHSCIDPCEGDCETEAFATYQCEGCGSYLHGERHAMTTWEAAE